MGKFPMKVHRALIFLSLLFWISLPFSFSRNSLRFWAFFPSFPRILGVRLAKEIPAFFWWFSLPFPEKQDKKISVLGGSGQNFAIFISCRFLVELGPRQLGLPVADSRPTKTRKTWWRKDVREVRCGTIQPRKNMYTQRARRGILMPRGKNCRETIFAAQLPRNYPHHEGNFEREKMSSSVGERQFGRHFPRQFGRG